MIGGLIGDQIWSPISKSEIKFDLIGDWKTGRKEDDDAREFWMCGRRFGCELGRLCSRVSYSSQVQSEWWRWRRYWQFWSQGMSEYNEAGQCESMARFGQDVYCVIVDLIYLLCERKLFIEDKVKVVSWVTGVQARAVNSEKLLLATDEQGGLQ